MTLEYLGEESVSLKDRSYRWVNVKRFRASKNEPPAAVLSQLLRHDQYRDHYTTPDSVTTSPIHGPYQLDYLSPASFDEIEGDAARDALREWVAKYGPVPDDQIDGDLAAVEHRLTSATTTFHLRDIGQGAYHDFGWVLTDFCEFVSIDYLLGEVDLIVAAGD